MMLLHTFRLNKVSKNIHHFHHRGCATRWINSTKAPSVTMVAHQHITVWKEERTFLIVIVLYRTIQQLNRVSRIFAGLDNNIPFTKINVFIYLERQLNPFNTSIQEIFLKCINFPYIQLPAKLL